MGAFRKAAVFVKHEFLSILPPTIYFLITFNIVVLTTSLVLDEYKVHVSFYASAAILALVVAKVVLVVDQLSFIRRFDRKPLAYPILFKAVAYSTFVLVFRLLEYWVTDEEIIWRFLAVSQIWMLVLFLIYFTFSELTAALGLSRRELAQVFFREHPRRESTET